MFPKVKREVLVQIRERQRSGRSFTLNEALERWGASSTWEDLVDGGMVYRTREAVTVTAIGERYLTEAEEREINLVLRALAPAIKPFNEKTEVVASNIWWISLYGHDMELRVTDSSGGAEERGFFYSNIRRKKWWQVWSSLDVGEISRITEYRTAADGWLRRLRAMECRSVPVQYFDDHEEGSFPSPGRIALAELQLPTL